MTSKSTSVGFTVEPPFIGRIERAPPRIRAGMGLLETSCAETAKALSDRLERELHGLQRLRVGRHLARCARCRATLASLGRLVRALRSLREMAADNRGSLVEDVLARIQERNSAHGRR